MIKEVKKAVDPYNLTDEELDERYIAYGGYKADDSEETKQRHRAIYRKLEAETNMLIAKYGGVDEWVESGDYPFLVV